MKALLRTITVFVAINLITAGFALAQPAPAPAPPEPAQVGTVGPELEEAREQLEAARRQLGTGRTEKEKALSKVKNELSELKLGLGMSLSNSDTGTVLVIPTSEIKPEELAITIEDMTVMARIIDKQLGKEKSKQILFYGNFLGGQSSRTAETIYLQGYGALFLKKVDFPLSPPPTVQEQESQAKEEDVDPVWEQMKQELYEPQESRRRRVEREEEKYDAEKVENLKTDLIKALKHAANIRNLKPAESVILTVTGSSGSSNITSVAIPGTGQIFVQNKETKTVKIVTPTIPGDLGLSSPTVLVIRAKKSDIDTFAKGDLDFDKFRERVQIFAYPFLGENTG